MKDDKFGTKKYFAGFFAILVIVFPFSQFLSSVKKSRNKQKK